MSGRMEKKKKNQFFDMYARERQLNKKLSVNIFLLLNVLNASA